MFNKESVPGTLTVAFLVCLVCAIVVATAAVSLRPVQQKNQLLDKQTNVLQAAGLYEPGMDVAAEFEKIERRFVELETGEYVEREPTYDMRRAARDPADSYTPFDKATTGPSDPRGSSRSWAPEETTIER